MLGPSNHRPGHLSHVPLNHRRTRAAAAMLVLVSFGVTACGERPLRVSSDGGQSPAPAGSITPPSAPASDTYDTTLERRGGRLRVNPVPSSYRPKVPKAKAFESFKARGVFPETAARETADIRLGLYTSDEANPTWPAFYHDQPAWVIRYDHVPGEPNPDPLGSTRIAPRLKAIDGPVDILVFIDAETGRYLNAVQDPVSAD